MLNSANQHLNASKRKSEEYLLYFSQSPFFIFLKTTSVYSC